MQKDVDKRLTLDQAKKHPFFKSINWDNVITKKELKAPIKPKVKNESDIRNIDKHITKQDVMNSSLGSTFNKNHLESVNNRFFQNFSYNPNCNHIPKGHRYSAASNPI